MRAFTTKRILFFAFLVAFLATTSGAQCIDNSMGFASWVGAGAAGQTQAPYHPKLSLFNSWHRYYYVIVSGPPLQPFGLSVDGVSWTSGLPNQFGSTHDLAFDFGTSPQPVCTATRVHVDIQRQVGWGAWIPECPFDLTIVSTENGEPRNLTFVNGISKAYYAGSDYKAHVMTWNGSLSRWDYAALNVLAPGWGSVQIDGRMASFANGSRLIFRGKDQKLYNLIQSGSNWTLSQVMASLPLVGGNVVARNNNEVVFVGGTQLHQLSLVAGVWFDSIVVPGGGWGTLGGALGDSVALPPSSSDIFFANGAGRLVRLYKTSSSSPWSVEIISPTSAYGTSIDYLSDLVAVENNAVYYRGRDRAIHRYTKNGSTWVFDPMTISNSSSSESKVVVQDNGYVTKFPGEDRVFYKGANGRIYNAYLQNGVWYNYSLSESVTDVAGDLIAAEGKIFYISHDKRIHNFHWSGNRWWDGPLSGLPQADTKGCTSAYYN